MKPRFILLDNKFDFDIGKNGHRFGYFYQIWRLGQRRIVAQHLLTGISYGAGVLFLGLLVLELRGV
jgi:hypothetical protein